MSTPIKTLRKFLGRWPRTAHDLFERHEEYACNGQYEAAIEELNEALRISALQSGSEPNESEGFQYLLARSELHTELGMHQQALADLEEADRRYGDDFGSLDEQRSYCLVELGAYQRAFELIARCDREYGLDADLKLARARCLAGLARSDEAANDFNTVITEAENAWGEAEPESYFYHGKFLLEQGKTALAMNDLARALAGWSDDVTEEEPRTRALMIDACHLKSNAHQMLGDTAAANSAKQQAEQWESDARNSRPMTIEQIQKDIRINAGIEIASSVIGLAILLWLLGPIVYVHLSSFVNLPPLPALWPILPGSLVAVSVIALFALVMAKRKNARAQGDEFLQRMNDYM